MKNKQKLINLLKEPLLTIGIKIDNIIELKEDNINFLRIIIDKEPYIDIDDCVEATKIINKIIDKVDISDESYVLDVCSKQKGGNING
ncbi:MAG: hypothetical protein PHY26_01830 [Bacilli bacterium]|nr:hypothetical protein [Bacilli bacterium]